MGLGGGGSFVRAEKLENAAVDIESIRTIPAGEQKKYYKTATGIFPELKLKDDCIETQKAQERLKVCKRDTEKSIADAGSTQSL